MVVISVSLVTKQGKILLARQFLEITRSNLEGLLNSFTKQVDINRQHTYIDQENARFVFQPLEDLYLVVITSKDSNIVEDIETLRLLYKVVQHYCPFGPDEANILKNCFELALAFDDVIALGYRESITLSQILTYAEMESAEERIFKEKQKAQMQEAKEQAKRKQAELDKKRSMESMHQKELPSMEEIPREVSRPVIPEKERVVEPVTMVNTSGKRPKGGMTLVSRGKKGMDF
ncbi:hypothetical protein SteCoe_2239 [Stentor coeruleus]|uniref:Coatomer subunit delta n=1 Tax=Stentor coeruleus TaxID=5963 RepID=A0A1R2D035_9CILI|nr:hypothetical protein SteCoe_2239 [Stentor coeruleus]